MGVILDRPIQFTPQRLFKVKRHKSQKYAKFVHHGPHETCEDTYTRIYAFWINEVDQELVDLPTLEYYPNDHGLTTPENPVTEIYIPVK